jgi:hypothetical protein
MQCDAERKKGKKERSYAVPEPAPNVQMLCKRKKPERKRGNQDNNSVNARSLMHRVNAQVKQNAMLCSMRKVCRVVLSSFVNRVFFFVVIVAARTKSEGDELLQEPAWRARDDAVSIGRQRRLVQMRRLTIY